MATSQCYRRDLICKQKLIFYGNPHGLKALHQCVNMGFGFRIHKEASWGAAVLKLWFSTSQPEPTREVCGWTNSWAESVYCRISLRCSSKKRIGWSHIVIESDLFTIDLLCRLTAMIKMIDTKLNKVFTFLVSRTFHTYQYKMRVRQKKIVFIQLTISPVMINPANKWLGIQHLCSSPLVQILQPLTPTTDLY